MVISKIETTLNVTALPLLGGDIALPKFGQLWQRVAHLLHGLDVAFYPAVTDQGTVTGLMLTGSDRHSAALLLDGVCELDGGRELDTAQWAGPDTVWVSATAVVASADSDRALAEMHNFCAESGMELTRFSARPFTLRQHAVPDVNGYSSWYVAATCQRPLCGPTAIGRAQRLGAGLLVPDRHRTAAVPLVGQARKERICR